jgi:GTP-binding protein EngB required for normal cell division
VARLAEGFGEETLAEEARTALQPLEENLLRMVALGQFKRGKSTLLNALLESSVLPSGVAPVTSVSTVVRWSPEPCLTVIYENGETRPSEFARLADFVVEARNPGNALDVRLVEVGYPASLLEDGLVLVDTPGIGSADRRATERAYGFLPSVDAGLVVLSPDPPVGEAEAEYIRELAALTPHLLFVLNKIDRVTEPEWREVLAFNQQVLADVLDQPAEDIDIIPVSARRALEDAGGMVETLRDRVASFIAQKGARVREDLAGRRLRAVAAKLRAGLDVERHALEMGERELDGRIEGLRATLASLQGRTDRATRAVMAAVEDIVERAGDGLLAHARSRSRAMEEALVDTLRSAEPEASNAAVAARFDQELADQTWGVLDAWWEQNGTGIVDGLLGEMGRASDDLLQARSEASEWIRSAFGVDLPEEPHIEALKESGSFYRRVEGVTPRLTVDMLRILLPRRLYRAWIRRSVPGLVARAVDMGAGQVRGDLLYRARETARTFAAELRTWTLAGTEGLVEAVGRASALRKQTQAAAQDRRAELDAGLAELDRLADVSP